MKPEETILKNAITALEASTNIFIDRRKISAAGPHADFELTYKTPNGEHKHLVVEVKQELTSSIVGQAAAQKQRIDAPLTIVAEYISSEFAKKLKEFDLQFFDNAGNAYLRDKNFYIFISGNKTAKPRDKRLGVFRPAGVKLILAFFTNPGLEQADYRTIEEESGVPKSSVGRVMKDLESAGYLFKRKETRVLRNKQQLIKRWAEYYSEKYRPKLKPIRYHSTKKEGRWWDDINIAEYNAFWGGETAGEKLTKYLRPQMATIYSDSKLNHLQAKYGLVRDPKGEVEILNKFWKFGDIDNVAPPLVVYADLLATADERNIETAKLIYEKYLADAAQADSQ